MIKYAAMRSLAMKIGFANEMANLCERVGAEATEVIGGIGLDSRSGRNFSKRASAGAAVCFGKDIQGAGCQQAREYG